MMLNRDTVFDYKTHRENFTNYLEVIIFKDGHIEYAIPSHQMKLVDIYCKENNITRNELYAIIPITEAPNDWITYNLGLIQVWYNFIRRPIDITKEQEETLKRLVKEKCINPEYRSFVIFKNKYENICSKEI